MSSELHPKTRRLLMRLLDRGVEPETIENSLRRYVDETKRRAEQAHKVREDLEHQS